MAILTVSREFGSGGREIGQAVADSLGYNYIDKSTVLNEIRAVGGKWEEWSKELDEHCPTIWEKYDWSFRGYGALLQCIVLDHASRNRVVVMGRGAGFLLTGIAHAFRIRVVAPLELRVASITKRDSIDPSTARWLAEKTDRERSCFLYALYGKHWDDLDEYDRVFDTSTQSIEDIVSTVIEVLGEKDRHLTDASRKLLQMRAAAAKIKAGLATNPAFFFPTLDVDYDGQDVIVRAILHNPKEQKRIEDAARKLAGDLPLRFDLHYRK